MFHLENTKQRAEWVIQLQTSMFSNISLFILSASVTYKRGSYVHTECSMCVGPRESVKTSSHVGQRASVNIQPCGPEGKC